jgi:glycosyltransferase involved in cell wall biosynthesis
MSMSTPLISIIMPVKNAGPFLEACLDSIQNQSYKNYELIAINDHSSDNSLEILHNYVHRFASLLVLNNNGLGIIDALKTGYAAQNGQFITRMDADDSMPPKKLEYLLDSLQNAGDGYVATGLVKYFSEGQLGEGYQKYEAWLNGLTEASRNFDERYKECVIPSPCWMMKTSDFEKIGGFNSTTYPEDYDLVFRMFEGEMKVVGVREICHHWRDHGQRASRNDENYADNNFLDLKLSYFLKLDYKPNKELFLWGAGNKGKYLAKQLIQQNIPFQWVCNNPKKIGKHIYDKILGDTFKSKPNEETQIIVAVANEESQESIKQVLHSTQAYYFA